MNLKFGRIGTFMVVCMWFWAYWNFQNISATTFV